MRLCDQALIPLQFTLLLALMSVLLSAQGFPLDINIISGWFPPLIYCLAIVLILVSIGWRRGVWKKELLWGIPIGLGVAAIIWTLQSVVKFGGYELFLYPYFVWTSIVGFSIALIFLGWKKDSWLLRVLAALAIVLSITGLGTAVNQKYGYYPTLGNVPIFGGQTAENTSSFADLSLIQKEVAKTGKLPAHGETVTVTIPATKSGFSQNQANVYLPPAWFQNPTPKLPVIEMFPGSPGTNHDWFVGGGADTTSDTFSATNKGLSPIIVSPDVNQDPTSENSDSECSDTASQGHVQTYLVQDLPTYIIKTFQTAPLGKQWGVSGLSEGGTCSSILGFRFPQDFSVMASFSGDSSPSYNGESKAQTITDLYGGSAAAYSANDPTALSIGKFPDSSAWFAVGQQDDTGSPVASEFQDAAKSLYALSTAPRVGMQSVCLSLTPGGHDFPFWKSAFENALPWIAWRLGIAPEPKSVQATCKPAIP